MYLRKIKNSRIALNIDPMELTRRNDVSLEEKGLCWVLTLTGCGDHCEYLTFEELKKLVKENNDVLMDTLILMLLKKIIRLEEISVGKLTNALLTNGESLIKKEDK